jgi:hypothetical protein
VDRRCGVFIDLGEHVGVLAGDLVVETLYAECELEALVEHRRGGFGGVRRRLAIDGNGQGGNSFRPGDNRGG